MKVLPTTAITVTASLHLDNGRAADLGHRTVTLPLLFASPRTLRPPAPVRVQLVNICLIRDGPILLTLVPFVFSSAFAPSPPGPCEVGCRSAQAAKGPNKVAVA